MASRIDPMRSERTYHDTVFVVSPLHLTVPSTSMQVRLEILGDLPTHGFFPGCERAGTALAHG